MLYHDVISRVAYIAVKQSSVLDKALQNSISTHVHFSAHPFSLPEILIGQSICSYMAVAC